MKKVIAAIVTAVVALAGPAGAGHEDSRASDRRVSHRDPGDVGNKLDIARVAFVGNGDGTATLAIETHEEWGCRYLNRDLIHDGGTAGLRWEVNANADPYWEQTAFIGCSGGRWHLTWGRRTFEAFRANGRSVSATLPLEKLGLDRRHLSFSAISLANGKFGDHIAVEETDAAPALQPLAH